MGAHRSPALPACATIVGVTRTTTSVLRGDVSPIVDPEIITVSPSLTRTIVGGAPSAVDPRSSRG
jgi:hypothetical protein